MADEYRYGMYNRPAGYGTAPEGWFNPQREGDYIYETVAYPRQLTAPELYKWQMFPVSDNAYAFQVGQSVMVNDCDLAIIVAHLPYGRYTVRFDSTGETSTAIVEELAAAELYDTPAGRAALAAETPAETAPADRPYDPDNITGQDDYEFALAWEKQQQARAETPAPNPQPVEPTRQQKLAEAYTLLEKVIELIESAVEGTSQEPRAQSYIIPHLRDWLVNENCSLDNLMSEIEGEYQGF